MSLPDLTLFEPRRCVAVREDINLGVITGSQYAALKSLLEAYSEALVRLNEQMGWKEGDSLWVEVGCRSRGLIALRFHKLFPGTYEPVVTTKVMSIREIDNCAVPPQHIVKTRLSEVMASKTTFILTEAE